MNIEDNVCPFVQARIIGTPAEFLEMRDIFESILKLTKQLMTSVDKNNYNFKCLWWVNCVKGAVFKPTSLWIVAPLIDYIIESCNFSPLTLDLYVANEVFSYKTCVSDYFDDVEQYNKTNSTDYKNQFIEYQDYKVAGVPSVAVKKNEDETCCYLS